MLLPTFLLFVLAIENFVCFDVKICWKFNAVHSTSGCLIFYNSCNKIECLFKIIYSGSAGLHSSCVFINDCILLGALWVNFNAIDGADSNDCFSCGDSVGKCQISELKYRTE